MSAGKIIEYATVHENEFDKFDRIVNVMLGEGWELYGGPYEVTEGNEDGSFCSWSCQALVLREADGKGEPSGPA